jgi:hypothetical protein
LVLLSVVVERIVITVVGGSLLTAVVGGVKWLLVADNRIALRQALCRHDWQPYPNYSGDDLVHVSPLLDYCHKCGKAV